MQSRLIPLLLVAGCLAACERPTTISGSARVVDGDSLEIGATSIRLHAVDAPEGQQTCTRNGETWRCGTDAANKLSQLVGRLKITCTKTDTDQYGRTVAICNNGSVDLGEELVLAGLALAYREYGTDYVRQEAEAQAAHRGMWAGDFTPPWEWRRNPQYDSPAPAAAASNDSGNCVIKGNIGSRGDRIYHVPGSPAYSQTVIDETKGERWFCTTQEALDAGWRAPRGWNL